MGGGRQPLAGPRGDLPADFEVSREVHHTALRQPLDPSAFVDEIRRRMRTALSSLDDAVSADATGGVRFVTRRGEPWITVPQAGKLPEPANLDRLKDQVRPAVGHHRPA